MVGEHTQSDPLHGKFKVSIGLIIFFCVFLFSSRASVFLHEFCLVQGGVLTERCYGCGRCLPVCPYDRISEHCLYSIQVILPSSE